jgi:hypothetical protein
MTRAKLIRALLAVVLSNVLIGVIAITQANRAIDLSEQRAMQQDEERDRRWCTLLGTLDDAYRLNPPVTDTGQKVARETARMRVQFGCPPSAVPQGDLRPTFPPRPTPSATR